MCAQWRVERRTIRVTAMGRMYEELPMGRKIMLSSLSGVWRPPTDVFESDDAYVIRVEISGLRQTAAGEIENAKLLVEGDLVVLRGQRSDDCPHTKCNYHQMEIQYGPFEVAVRDSRAVRSRGDHDEVSRTGSSKSSCRRPAAPSAGPRGARKRSEGGDGDDGRLTTSAPATWRSRAGTEVARRHGVASSIVHGPSSVSSLH